MTEQPLKTAKAKLTDPSKLKFRKMYQGAKTIKVRVNGIFYPITKEMIMRKAINGTITNGDLSRFTPESVEEAKQPKPTTKKKSDNS